MTIRPLELSDLSEVTSLYEHVSRSGKRVPPPGLDRYFERSFFEQPWADSEIPSLVHVDEDGAIVGFIGSSVRLLDFEGETIRMAFSTQLVADPKARSRAVGAFLLKSYLAGPQDMTITDEASDEVRRMWEGLGGETLHLECIGWIRAFRPWVAAAELGARRKPGLARTLRPVAPALDAATRRLVSRLAPDEPRGTSEELTPALLVEHLPAVARGTRLRPAYDESTVGWLLREVEAVTSHGTLVRRLVRHDTGEVAGWFVYYAKKGGVGQVLQIAAPERSVDPVLDHLFFDAESRGVTALRGRMEAHLREPLSKRDCYLRRSDALALVHSRRADLLYAAHSGRALLSRLEGGWWMGHHLFPFD
jgi:hypothetical protein